MTTKIIKSLLVLSAAGIIFIGIRFIVAPEIGEAGFGIAVPNNGDFAFHYIKGVRDIFMGAILLLLTFSVSNRLLGWATLLGALVPVGDLLIVLSRTAYTFAHTIPHLVAVVLCVSLGSILIASVDTR